MGLVLAALSGLAWSGVDAFRKALAHERGPIAVVVLVLAGQLPIFGAWAALVDAFGAPTLDLRGYAPVGGATAALNLLANLAFTRALAIAPLSRTIPFLAFTPVFATLGAYVGLDEVPSPRQLAGVGAVVAGALALTFGRAEGRPKLRFDRATALMLFVAGAWAISASLDKAALTHVPVPVHALFQTLTILLALGGLLAVKGGLPELAPSRAVAGPWLGAVVCMAAATGLQYLAISRVLVGLVETIKRAIGGLMALAVGRLAFGEPLTPAKLLGVALTTAGATAIMWP